YTRRAWTQKAEEATYPLHKGRFKYGQYQTNSLGFLNGPKGNREVAIPKPSGMLRVNCIGASTTGNYIEEGGVSYSYPMELEKILQSRIGSHVEVNNCAQGGYNSADLLVRFALQVVDTKPDIVVIYHAYNDVRSYLTGNFSSDYSHSRRNIGERYWLYDLSSRIPNVPLKFFNFLIRLWLPSNIRYSLSTEVSRGTFDTDINPSEGLGVYKRNMKHIIDLCLSNGSKVILSTYAIYLFEEIKDSAIHQMYRDIVSKENDIMRELAKEYNIPLVDNAALIPKEESMFVDSVHFTPEGMSAVASNISDAIISMNKSDD
ncbi:MAG: hypothetical protein KAJ19_29870, partial [Gammaproteobacteria bacterium]|nr:hypothetical protein [Gammaproteobacteria bacterium]